MSGEGCGGNCGGCEADATEKDMAMANAAANTKDITTMANAVASTKDTTTAKDAAEADTDTATKPTLSFQL